MRLVRLTIGPGSAITGSAISAVLLSVGLLAGLMSVAALAAGSVRSAAAPRLSIAAAPRVVPAFNVGWKQAPANGSLTGISCLSASDCMAVGQYTDILGNRRSLAELWNGRQWRVLRGLEGAGLSGVSCTSASFCVAVGSVIEKWNGTTWKVLKQPSGASGTVLFGVSCTRTSFCMAVGSDSAYEANMAEAWNGTAWRSLKTPGNGCVPFCGLAKVACRSAIRCVAVGSTGSNSDLSDFSEAMRWNGKAWQETPTPSPYVSTSLSGISCPGTADCLAVGNYSSEAPPCNCVLADGWNGSTWQHISTPPIGGNLSGVSCPAVHDCLAVGGPLALTWNGSTWHQLTIATPGETGTSLSDVSCWAASACMAVGDYTNSSGAQLTLAEKWNGSSWQVERTRTPADPFSGLSGVSCLSASKCVAVGTYISRSDTEATLAEKWNGRAWAVQATPNPGAHVSVLSAVSCPGASTCMAVGYYDTAGGTQALAERWDGSVWQVLPVAHNGMLTSVSCLTADDCLAVGSYLSSSGTRLTLAAIWNGSTWHVQPTPNPGATISELSGISCSSGVSCKAVGANNANLTSSLRPLTLAWNGSTWRVQPNPGGARQLAAISCPRPVRCMAVGSYLAIHGPHLPSGTVAEIWNGTAWSVSRTPNPPGMLRDHLGAVSCAMASGCQAVGGVASTAGNAFAIAEAWNGTRWQLLRIPSPSHAFNDLYGISCPAATRCIAVGGTGAQLALAERWDGTRWQPLRTQNP